MKLSYILGLFLNFTATLYGQFGSPQTIIEYDQRIFNLKTPDINNDGYSDLFYRLLSDSVFVIQKNQTGEGFSDPIIMLDLELNDFDSFNSAFRSNDYPIYSHFYCEPK